MCRCCKLSTHKWNIYNNRCIVFGFHWKLFGCWWSPPPTATATATPLLFFPFVHQRQCFVLNKSTWNFNSQWKIKAEPNADATLYKTRAAVFLFKINISIILQCFFFTLAFMESTEVLFSLAKIMHMRLNVRTTQLIAEKYMQMRFMRITRENMRMERKKWVVSLLHCFCNKTVRL